MLKFKILLISCLLIGGAFSAGSANAQSDELALLLSQQTNDWEVSQGDAKMKYRFSGYDKEKGTWHLYMRNRADNSFDNTPLANELNALEPSAGVEFNWSF